MLFRSDVLEELAEAPARVPLGRAHAEDVEPVLGERAGFVEAADVDLPRDVHPARRDAEDTQLAQAADCESRSDGERGGQGGWDDYSDEVERAQEDGVPSYLENRVKEEDVGIQIELHSRRVEQTEPRSRRSRALQHQRAHR